MFPVFGDWFQLDVCILVPAPSAAAARKPCDGVAHLIFRSLIQHTTRLVENCGISAAESRVRVASYHAPSRHLFDVPSTRPLRLSAETGLVARNIFDELLRSSVCAWAEFRGVRRVLAFLSASYAIGKSPPLGDLVRACWRDGLACAGTPECTLYAVALKLPTSRMALQSLHELLSWLVSTENGAELGCKRVLKWMPWVLADSFGPERSPALGKSPAPRVPADRNSPRSLNTALAEMIFDPLDGDGLGLDAEQLRLALIARRDRSRVPWVFNALANEVEYRIACPEPLSFPPEFHLSLSGLCNIECKFCSYAHSHARPDQVSVEQIARLGFLRHVRILRLNSGNGEPTVNRQLPAIIRYIREVFPHVSMNFFTNGILLGRANLISALIDSQVAWISVSVNAADRRSWQELCHADQFERLCGNLRTLLQERRVRSAVYPVVYGSMVLTRQSVNDLSRMPALCRRLGIDRFTAIPFFSLGYERADRFDAGQAYHHIGDAYDAIYASTVSEARMHQVSVELPRPRHESAAAFGVESRVFHDFARIEPDDASLNRLLTAFQFEHAAGTYCPFLWRQAAVASSSRLHNASGDSHFLYPCLGPLAAVDFSGSTPFRFPDEGGFKALWQNSLWRFLRQAQSTPGHCRVCETCRQCDSRSPENMPSLNALVRDFAREHGLVAT